MFDPLRTRRRAGPCRCEAHHVVHCQDGGPTSLDNLKDLGFEFSTRAFVPLVVASSLGAGMHALIFGTGPLFSVPAHSYSGIENTPVFLLLGVACGVLAVRVHSGEIAEKVFATIAWPSFKLLGMNAPVDPYAVGGGLTP